MVGERTEDIDGLLAALEDARQEYMRSPDGGLLENFRNLLRNFAGGVMAKHRVGDRITFNFRWNAESFFSVEATFDGEGIGAVDVMGDCLSLQECLQEFAEHAGESLEREPRRKDRQSARREDRKPKNIPERLNAYSRFLEDPNLPISETFVFEGIGVEIAQRFYCRKLDVILAELPLRMNGSQPFEDGHSTYWMDFKDGCGVLRSGWVKAEYDQVAESYYALRCKNFIKNPSFDFRESYIRRGIAERIRSLIRRAKAPIPPAPSPPPTTLQRIEALDWLRKVWFQTSANGPLLSLRHIYCLLRGLSGAPVETIAEELGVRAPSSVYRPIEECIRTLSARPASEQEEGLDWHCLPQIAPVKIAQEVMTKMGLCGARAEATRRYRIGNPRRQEALAAHKRVLWELYSLAQNPETCIGGRENETLVRDVMDESPRPESRIVVQRKAGYISLEKYERLPRTPETPNANQDNGSACNIQD